MKTRYLISLFSLFIASLLFTSFSVDSSESLKKIYVSKELNVPADRVWETIAVKYDEVQNSHPKISTSMYVGNHSECKEGAQRRVNFNKEGTKYMIEEIQSLKTNEMTILLNVLEVGEIPIKPNLTKSLFKVEDIGGNRSKVSCVMQFETSPAFLGSMVKGKLKSKLINYFIAVEHHVKTGENVNRTNFPKIKKLYGRS